MALEDFLVNPPVHPKLMQAFGAMQSLNPDLDELFAELGRAVSGARQEETRTRSAFEQALAQGPPRTNPFADAIVRSMGSAADMFRGGTGSGGALARETIAGEQGRLLQKRKENLMALEGAYTRAAERAAKLGDFDTETKFLTKKDAALKNVDNLSKMLMANAEFELGKEGRAQEQADRLGLEHLRQQGAKELSHQESQQAFGQNVVIQQMRDRESRAASLISQGMDPDNPGQVLTGSKAQRIAGAQARGFLPTSRWTGEYFDMVNQSRQGKPTFRGASLTNRILQLPPDMAFADKPDAWLRYLLSLQDPNDRRKYLIPRGRDNKPQPAWDTRVREHMMRYFPDWIGPVSDIDSVGR